MKRKTIAVLIVIVAIAVAVMLVGCVEDEIPVSTPTTTQLPISIPTPSSTLKGPIQNQKSDGGSQTLGSLAGWWLPKWSEDSMDLNVGYTQGRSTLSEVTHVGKSYDPFGVQVEGSVATYRKGEDIYGREQNTAVGTVSTFHGGSVKPDSVLAYGNFTYPAEAEFEQSVFSRRFNVTINSEYDQKGRLAGGSGKEEFSGHISTLTGKITYSGSAPGTFTVKDGQLVWSERVEKTNYYYEDEPYAETVTVITPQSEYLGGRWVTVSETVKTAVAYADRSKRESEIMILWQRNAAGVPTGKKGSGTVTGTEIVNGKSVDYTGSITIDYGFDSRIGWYKAGYSEKRSAETVLPKRLPFEVIFIDDPYLRSVF